MRPVILNTLFTEASTLPGVGSRMKALLSRLAAGDREQGALVKDVLLHLPSGCVDRRAMPDLLTAPDGQVITALVEVEEYLPPKPNTRQPFKVICRNETGYLTLIFFHFNENYIVRELPLGQKRVVSGRVERFDSMLQMAHPDAILLPDQLERALRVEPVYPLTLGISNKFLGKVMEAALARAPELPEWQEQNFREKHHWQGWKAALAHLHHPEKAEDAAPVSSTWARLAYDELLANQLALGITRGLVHQKAGRIVAGDGRFRERLVQSLPFSLTGGQQEVVREILADMASGKRMLRLLQGDVGSGKTVVALLAMLNAAECGRQAALMAPTELLARQHYARLSAMLEEAGLLMDAPLVFLSGRDKGKQRQEALARLADGDVLLTVGTHALFQDDVVFHDLALAVIDEQHRFGVKQRLALARKGTGTDILLMTATPIPRTLTLTFYGDMEVSTLKEKPAGRTPIDTRIMHVAREMEVIEGLKRAVAKGNRVYWVCPLIEENNSFPLEGEGKPTAAAEARFAVLKGAFDSRVGLAHGQLPPEKRDAAMLAFTRGELDVLVATTVIEVGVDVPEATIMVIEQAERFGLAQLHQLRGRVGRGGAQSHCILLYSAEVTETGVRRLSILRETEDGFRIAEEDLMLRGSGELLGTKQSGMPGFKIARFPEHGELLLAARDDVKLLLAHDPRLESPRGKALRTLLYLFEYDAQMQYLAGG